MTIQVAFRLASDHIITEIEGNNLMFLDVSNGQLAPLDNLKFNRKGVIEEFPDLEDDDEWKKKAIERLKEHIKKIKTEKQKAIYVAKELEKYGYQILYAKRNGHRPKSLERL